MKTSKQIEAEFRAELQELLNKYGAEIEAKDYWQGYAECGEDVRMTVTIPSEWVYTIGGIGTCTSEYTEIDLGRYVEAQKGN